MSLRYRLLLARERRHLDAEERILAALDDGSWRYGLDLIRASGMRSGRAYPALWRLEGSGVIEAGWADLEPGREHRRRLYRIAGGEP